MFRILTFALKRKAKHLDNMQWKQKQLFLKMRNHAVRRITSCFVILQKR